LKRNISAVCVGAAILLIAAAGTTSAQVLDDVEDLDWELTSLGPPRAREPWSFEIGLELDNLPHLDEGQRRIGFGGAKVEDLPRWRISTGCRPSSGRG